jgi:hypothetical protein
MATVVGRRSTWGVSTVGAPLRVLGVADFYGLATWTGRRVSRVAACMDGAQVVLGAVGMVVMVVHAIRLIGVPTAVGAILLVVLALHVHCTVTLIVVFRVSPLQHAGTESSVYRDPRRRMGPVGMLEPIRQEVE